MKKGNKTRKRAIDKTLQLFSVKGYYNTSIGDILESTQLTKGGLYGHFKNKEALWYAVYDEAVARWRRIVFHDIRGVTDPLKRIQTVVDNHLLGYLGGNLFAGGCFFLNSMIEMAGQSEAMVKHLLRGFDHLPKLIRRWLDEASKTGLIAPDLNHIEIANFVVVALNGASSLYAGTHDPFILRNTSQQLRQYTDQLRIHPC